MVRDPLPGDPHKEPEPWTWVRKEGKGRVFYTASGHDERVWKNAGFQNLLKQGILWAVGDSVRKRHETFLASREPLKYEKRDNVPNYERRPEPLPFQLPLSPEESIKHTQVPVGFSLELFVSEPEIVNPIYFQWDSAVVFGWSRAWTIRMKSSRARGNGSRSTRTPTRTKQKFTIFADGFRIHFRDLRPWRCDLAHAPAFSFSRIPMRRQGVREFFAGFGRGIPATPVTCTTWITGFATRLATRVSTGR